MLTAPYHDKHLNKVYNNIPVEVYLNQKKINSMTWDEEYVVCREEEMYALMSPGWKNKKIRVIYIGWLHPNGNGYKR